MSTIMGFGTALAAGIPLAEKMIELFSHLTGGFFPSGAASRG